MRIETLGLQPATLTCLHNMGIINLKQLLEHSTAACIEHPDIGPAKTYEVLQRLNRRGLTLPTQRGIARVPSPRNLEMFRLRFIEQRTMSEIGRLTGVSRARVHQLLRYHYGIATLPFIVREQQRKSVSSHSSAIPTDVHLGNAIRRLRLARYLSLDAVALDARIHLAHLSRIDRGQRSPSWSTLGGIADALKVTMTMLTMAAEAEACGADYTPNLERLR